jgi:hypothetical protein
MTTIPATLMPARIRRTSAVLTAAGALVAVGIAALFLALAGPTRSSHTAIRHPAPTYYPLIHYRGTGAPPATTHGSVGWVPLRNLGLAGVIAARSRILDDRDAHDFAIDRANDAPGESREKALAANNGNV